MFDFIRYIKFLTNLFNRCKSYNKLQIFVLVLKKLRVRKNREISTFFNQSNKLTFDFNRSWNFDIFRWISLWIVVLFTISRSIVKIFESYYRMINVLSTVFDSFEEFERKSSDIEWIENSILDLDLFIDFHLLRTLCTVSAR